MSLRSRLTTAFLVVVLGPVLVGAVFVAAIVSHLSNARTAETLDASVATVDSGLDTICERIQASAAAVALNYGNADVTMASDMADLVVDRAVVDGVIFEDAASGAVMASFGQEPPEDEAWAECGENIGAQDRAVVALSSESEVRLADGATVLVYAFRLVNEQFIANLSHVADADIVLDDGRDVPLSFGGVDSARWSFTGHHLPLRVGVPDNNISPMYWTLGAMVAISALCAVALASWLSRSTTRPLSELSRAADKVTDGDLETRVPVHGRDEVAQLALTFNHMTAQTQRYVQALTASRDQMRGQLDRLGQTLSATLDLDRILEVILDTAMVTTGAEAGVVMLVDIEDSDQLVQRAGEGILGIEGPALVRLGEGVIGSIAATGLPARGRMVDGKLDDWRRVDTEPDAQTVIAVPFGGRQPNEHGLSSGRQPNEPVHGGGGWESAPRGGVLGVLVVYDRIGGDDFEESDVDTLRTFAGQVAVAVENVLLHRQAQRLSITDPLTGLWNYRFMQSSLRREAERTRRYERPTALLAIDLDRFKGVNDTYGHPVGDQVLVELSRRITSQIREVDLAFRHGGEEFMVLLPETDAAGAAAVAERLAKSVSSRPFKVSLADGRLELHVTVSLGIAVLGVHAETASGVLAAADEALYAAKAAGRDTWRVAHG